MSPRRLTIFALLFAGGCWFDLEDVVTETSTSSSSASSSSGGVTSSTIVSSSSGQTASASSSAGSGGEGGTGGEAPQPVGTFIDCLDELDYAGACFGDPSSPLYVYSDEEFDNVVCKNLDVTNKCVIQLCEVECITDRECTGYMCDAMADYDVCQDHAAGWSTCHRNVAFRRVGASQCEIKDCAALGAYCHEDPADCWPFPP